MKKYKLLKDIPGFKSGALLTDQSNTDCFSLENDNCRSYSEEYLKRYPDFFEEVIELEKLFTIEDIYSAVEFGCNACLTHDYVDETEKFIKKYFPQYIDQLKHLK